MSNILVIGILPSSILRFRKELLLHLVSKGHNVSVIASSASASEVYEIENLGLRYIDVLIEGRSLNPFTNIVSLWMLGLALIRINPDVVLSYTIKPNIFLGIINIFIRRFRHFPLVTGLGSSFSRGGFSKAILAHFVYLLYRIAFSRAIHVFFQNVDDMEIFTKSLALESGACSRVFGTGVPLDYYSYVPPPATGCIFLMITRLLVEKGVLEFIAAAGILKDLAPGSKFVLVGGFEGGPDGVSVGVIDGAVADGWIEYFGHVDDVRPYLADSHVFVLPSYYREGLPRSILEAMSVGRAILTTDNVGCRDTVTAGVNGWLVPVRDVPALADKMLWCVSHQREVFNMGLASRSIAASSFDVNLVIATMYDKLRPHL